MSGADLANLLNEGAIVAARQNKAEIDAEDIANALERIAIGLEKKDVAWTYPEVTTKHGKNTGNVKLIWILYQPPLATKTIQLQGFIGIFHP